MEVSDNMEREQELWWVMVTFWLACDCFHIIIVVIVGISKIKNALI